MLLKSGRLATVSVVALLVLSGCSQGSLPGVNPLPTPTPTPTPAPTPTPTSTFDTAEFRRSNAVTSSNAITAYEAGATGRNVVVAVIDSGVDGTSAEFAGRISPLSRDAAGLRGIGDEDGHGTEVSGILLAARNNSGIHGVAYEATLLSIRADRPGSCATECAYLGSAIASGLDTATSAGARVVNLSLGGPLVSLAVGGALARVTAANAVVVISAGNDGNTEVDQFAASGLAAAQPGTLIVAGAVDADGAIADFSNRAGVVANNYLVALGVSVRSFDETGAAFLYSGTSESAPIISGAAALLAGQFPTLTNVQIVDLLLRTADDLGAPGTDAVFGRGRLNIARAFGPVGGLSVSQVAVPLGVAGGSLGAAVGDAGATGMALSRVVARDDYDRAYTINVAATLRGAAPGRLANALFGGEVRGGSVGIGGIGLSFATRGDAAQLWRDTGWRGETLAMGNQAATRQSQLVSGRAVVPIDGARTMALGFGQPLMALADGAAGQGGGPDTLVARIDGAGLAGREIGGAALAQRIGGFTATVAIGETRIGDSGGRADLRGLAPASATRALLRLDRAVGPVQLGIIGETLVERGALFGSRLSAPFGVNGGTTTSAGVQARLPLGQWTLAGEARLGSTRANLTGSGLIQRLSGLTGTAASISVARDGVFGAGDQFSLTVAQPMRASGQAALALGGDAAEWTHFGPSGREIATELGYGRAVGSGWFSMGLFWRDQPGHIATAAPDAGGAVRYRVSY